VKKKLSLLDASWKILFKNTMVLSEKEIQLNCSPRKAKLRVPESVSVGSKLQSGTVFSRIRFRGERISIV